MTSRSSALATIAALTLTGCAGDLSGVGGSPTYGCQAPKGTVCTSVSGVYANSLSGDRSPVWSILPTDASIATTDKSAASSAPAIESPPSPKSPDGLRTAPHVLRLWIAPWEDSDGDLHEASIVHVLVNSGQWRMSRVRPTRDMKPEVTRPAAPAGTTAPPSTPPNTTTR